VARYRHRRRTVIRYRPVRHRAGPSKLTTGQVVAIAIVALSAVVSALGGPDRLLAMGGDDAGCARSSQVPDLAHLAEVREATLCLLNRERGLRDLPPLIVDQRLTTAAQRHSQDMGARDFYAHRTPDGRQPHGRILAVGLPASGVTTGENIHWGVEESATPSHIVRDWMQSPGHKENILRPTFTRIGIGVGFDPPEFVRGRAGVYTTNFAGYPGGS
jgi:uncharacterized protein YkwD